MSGSNCPRPRYGQYKCGSSFQGTIMSVHSSERGLFYALDSMMDDNFYKIDEHRPEVEFKKPEEIKFGDPFIFFDQIRNSYSRAYRLNSSPANKLAIRAFLFDIGVEVYQNFTKGQYFKFPNDFKLIPPMALFCVIDSFPAREDVEIKSEFLENSVFRRMKFNVKREMKINNSLGSNQLCLMVDVENVEELKEDSEALDQFTWHNQNKQESLEKEEKFASDLSFMDGSGDEHVPFPADFVLQDSYLPEPGAKILIYRTEVLNPWSLYARYNIEENLTNDYFPESLSVELLMNDDDVVESYENLCGEPVVGEMVITMGRDHRYHRGLVEEIAGDSYIIFFVDYGYTLPVEFEDIYKFPRECAALPFQAVHLTIAGMTSFGDLETDMEAVEIISKKLSSAMAIVESSSHNGLNLEMTVKAYDHSGADIVRTLVETIKKPLLCA